MNSENKPSCKLAGEDGNVFNLIGIVKRTLVKDGQRDRANEFVLKAMKQKSYDDVLILIMDYVEVE